MATINIANRDDPFYRYKMPKLISKIEGKGNGIKTVIPNMADIAKALSRPPQYPTKFFGCELGAQTTMDESNSRYIVNGSHDAPKLQGLLDVFIKKFVLCDNCGNPETDLVIKKDLIYRVCMACGKTTLADNAHKLTTYILKNPPPESARKVHVKKAKDAKERVDASPTPEEDADEGGSDIEKEAAALPTARDDDEDDDDWAEDLTAEAIAARQKELGVAGAVAKMTLEDCGTDPLDEFADFVLADPKLKDAEIVAKAKELGVREDKAVVVLAQILFDENAVKQIKQRAALLRQFYGKRPEKSQKGLLGGIERLVTGEHKATLLPRVPLILKELYDQELVDEEVLLAWGEHASKKYVDRKTASEIRSKAKPFLDWLQTAEEDSSEEESE